MLNGRLPIRQMKMMSESLNEGRAKIPAPAPVQKRANRTGLPDKLKAGVENLSGLAMDDVRVHYNSGAPARVQALAYVQGADIHVAPGQEKHLPHEAWHVVQQKQGRVRATRQLKGQGINEDAGLEREADIMGSLAATATAVDGRMAEAAAASSVLQLVRIAIPVVPAGDVTTKKLADQLALLDQEIASIEPEEVESRAVDPVRLAQWRQQYRDNLTALSDLVVNENAGMSLDRIRALHGANIPAEAGRYDERRLAALFFQIQLNHDLMRTMLNDSLAGRQRRAAEAKNKGGDGDKQDKGKAGGDKGASQGQSASQSSQSASNSAGVQPPSAQAQQPAAAPAAAPDQVTYATRARINGAFLRVAVANDGRRRIQLFDVSPARKWTRPATGALDFVLDAGARTLTLTHFETNPAGLGLGTLLLQELARFAGDLGIGIIDVGLPAWSAMGAYVAFGGRARDQAQWQKRTRQLASEDPTKFLKMEAGDLASQAVGKATFLNASLTKEQRTDIHGEAYAGHLVKQSGLKESLAAEARAAKLRAMSEQLVFDSDTLAAKTLQMLAGKWQVID